LWQEEEQILRAWNPKPLVDEGKLAAALKIERSKGSSSSSSVVEGRPGKWLEVTEEGGGGRCRRFLNLATHNYLGLVDEPSLDTEAERCIRKYGVGSCGPRGFYGTVGKRLPTSDL
jgi:serine palmitoyltransferase